MNNGKGTLGLGGGSYGLIGIGVGLAVSHLGTSIFMSMVSGLFWPATLGYWANAGTSPLGNGMSL